MEITITADTVIKPSAAQSSELDPADLVPVKKGQTFPVLAYREDAGHLVFTLDASKVDLDALHPSRKNTWWVYIDHAEDPSGVSKDNDPKDKPEPAPRNKASYSFKLPGFDQTFWSSDPICPESPNFTWRSALHMDAQGNYRKPDNAEQVANIIRAAKGMQAVREKLGNRTITITSWLRPYAVNKAVGGAKQSRHTQGDGVDFAVSGMTPWQVYEALDSWHGSKGGLAQGGRMGFVHIDWRGYSARWRYPRA